MRGLQARVNIIVALSSREPTWIKRDREAALKLRVDHDYVAGGARPEGQDIRDRPFIVSCPANSSANHPQKHSHWHSDH